MFVCHVGTVDALVVRQLLVGPHLHVQMLPQSELPHDIATCGRHQGGSDNPIEPVSVHVCHGASLGHMFSAKKDGICTNACVCVSMCVCMGVRVCVCVCMCVCMCVHMGNVWDWTHMYTIFILFLPVVIALIWAIPTFCALPNRLEVASGRLLAAWFKITISQCLCSKPLFL